MKKEHQEMKEMKREEKRSWNHREGFRSSPHIHSLCGGWMDAMRCKKEKKICWKSVRGCNFLTIWHFSPLLLSITESSEQKNKVVERRTSAS